MFPAATAVLALIVLGAVYVSPLLSVYAGYYIGALATAILVPDSAYPPAMGSPSSSCSRLPESPGRFGSTRFGVASWRQVRLAFVMLPLDFGAGLMFKVLDLHCADARHCDPR